MQRQVTMILLAAAALAACHTAPPAAAPIPITSVESDVQGTVVGDDRTAMEAALDAGPGSSTPGASAVPRAAALAPDAPDSYVVKRGDTLWGISKIFLKDPWYWPEIWQVNPQVQNPHLIYPGDTLRLVFIDGQPKLMLQRGDSARVEPRVRSQPLEAAVTTIPYEVVAAFMSKPTVLASEQIKGAPYVLSTKDSHIVMADGNLLYARGFAQPVQLGTHYSVVRVGDALRDPDDDRVLGYDGIFTGAGHISRSGDPATFVLTESARETEPGDKLFAGSVDVPLDFIPSAPKVKINGRIMAVSDGVTVIGQYQVVVINRGARDGLAPGNVLAIFDVGDVVKDNVKHGYFGRSAGAFGENVKLPDERSGTFMVFKTFEHMSYGLIMEAKDIIRIADRVENP